MKIVNIVNHGFVKFGYNLYKNLETINKHKELLLYCLGEETLECVKKLDLQCEVKLYSFSDIFKPKNIKIETNTIYDPCICDEYFYINFLKYDAFYQTLKEEGTAIYLDSDIAVLGDFIEDTLELLQEYELVFTFENYPKASLTEGGPMFNGGYFGVNKTLNMEKFFIELINSFDKPGVDMYYTTPIFRKYQEEIKWKIPSEKTIILNHCGYRHNVKLIKEKNTKAYHPTFFNVQQKIRQFKELDRWFGGDLFQGIEKYVKQQR